VAVAFDDVYFCYAGRNEAPALQGINLAVREGELVAVAGPNGSGKSTLCHLINGLILPARGKVLTCGMDTTDPSSLSEIRRRASLIMQNPDNQIVGPTVEDDVAFGCENLSLPRPEIQARVEETLKIMKLCGLRGREPHLLSIGERKRLAMAGALALRPSILLSDESTSMLDPPTRIEAIEMFAHLREEMDMTIIHATHQPEEIMACDRVLVLSEGRLVYDGGPDELFESEYSATEYGLRVPPIFLLARELESRGFRIPRKPLPISEVVERLWASS
jgi:energy-coupling factor transport system ATP-binding protein